jgi:hypothetical protein
MFGSRWISRAPDPIPVADRVALALIAAVEVASAVLIVRMWRERGGVLEKLLWTVVTLVPVLGIIAHLVWRDPPPPRGPTDRAPPRDWDVPR